MMWPWSREAADDGRNTVGTTRDERVDGSRIG